jgi:hypothetical protein
MTSASEVAVARDDNDDNESAIEENDADCEDDDNESAIQEDNSVWQDVDNESAIEDDPDWDGEILYVTIVSKHSSHSSLLTTALEEGDRAQTLQNEASRSSAAIRRSHTNSFKGPSIGNPPQKAGLMMRQSKQKSKPIIMTSSNVHPPAMSPRTTRRLMLTQELTSSLRQNLLWERQQRNTTTNAVAKRQQSAISLPALRRAATTSNLPSMSAETQHAKGSTAPFMDDAGLYSLNQEVYAAVAVPYHSEGW